jgi:hypothetical protein
LSFLSVASKHNKMESTAQAVLPAKVDFYNGVTVEAASLPPVAGDFDAALAGT